VLRQARQADGSIQQTEKIIRIPQGDRKSIASELFGPKDRSFIYTTDFPFFKDYVFDYSQVVILRNFIDADILGRLVYLLVVIFIVTAVSNGVNLTDGIDGLAAGTTAIVGAAMGVFAYVSGRYDFLATSTSATSRFLPSCWSIPQP
jgi:UDP-N-acetylmuramyl pentapeptide phosphotransferase/UDP-N-acetylglucosamine-1-phosphate transferase